MVILPWCVECETVTFDGQLYDISDKTPTLTALSCKHEATIAVDIVLQIELLLLSGVWMKSLALGGGGGGVDDK